MSLYLATMSVKLLVMDTLGQPFCPLLGEKIKSTAAIRNAVWKSVLCWEVVPFLEGPVSEGPHFLSTTRANTGMA